MWYLIVSIPDLCNLTYFEPTCFLPLTKLSFFVQSTTHNASYVHPKLDSIIEFCRAIPIVHDCVLAIFVHVRLSVFWRLSLVVLRVGL